MFCSAWQDHVDFKDFVCRQTPSCNLRLTAELVSTVFFLCLGEPSPPSIHGQPGSGKSFKLSITKQDDGGAPILEYIVKYRSVSISVNRWILLNDTCF